MELSDEARAQALQAASSAKHAVKAEAVTVADATPVVPATTGEIPSGYGKTLNRIPDVSPDKG